ncbi:MAG TPA: ATP-binding protein, partial [Sphingomonas sp.]|nr:ATP-binding protein [Sphingomonas sp.]
MDDLLTDFIAETRETLEALAGEIVAWEADPSDRARLDAIFRFVHTVKGSCGFLDLPRLQRLSHAAEDSLAEVRSGERVPDAALVSAVLAVIDRIGELTDALEANADLPEGEEEFLIAALAKGAVVEHVPEPANIAKISVMSNAAPTRAVSRSIRLPVELLDRMMAGVSDMVLARNELSRLLRVGGADSSTDVAFERLSHCVGEMRDAITRTRMSRIDALFTALPRMVRDLAAELKKTVKLEVDGGDVELDREMIEMIRDPLTHIVRNALDHGIENPEDRRKAGKPETGRLRIGARQSANQILIEVSDDGRGIDAERVVRKAISVGLVTSEQASTMNWSRKLDLIFEPGLSTANQVTGISGRGVGMDVVRANIERIGGTVDIESNPGQGLRLSLRVPLTLTIIPALTVSAGDTHFAIPRSAIDELVRPKGDQVRIERIGGEM